MKAKALTIAKYNFTNDKGREINTTKMIVSLGEFGCFTVCSELANEIPLFEVIDVQLGFDDRVRKNDGLVIEELI